MDQRSARLAQNEAVFRAGNDAINRNLSASAPDELPYLCECGVDTCFERVFLTQQEYEEVRSHPACFFVVPGHEDVSAGEVVVQERTRYRVVEKRGGEREIVERNDREE